MPQCSLQTNRKCEAPGAGCQDFIKSVQGNCNAPREERPKDDFLKQWLGSDS